MAQKTRASVALTQAGVPFATLHYDYEGDSRHIGLHAAAAIGEEACRVLKTLMVSVDGKPACAVVPADGELSMKRVAAAFGGKSARMLPPADAERVTGYHVGGISPFGMRKKVPTAMEETVFSEASVVINAGQRGEMVRLAPEDARRVLGALRAPLLA